MSKTFFCHGRVLQGDTVLEDACVVLNHVPSGGKLELKDSIEAVGLCSDDTLPKPGEGDQVFDVTGYTLVPGLVDANTRLDLHKDTPAYAYDELGIPYRTLLSFRHASEALWEGVTTLRTAGMPDGIDLALSQSYTKFLAQGPELISSGPEYIAHGGLDHNEYGKRQCSGADAFRGAARYENSKGTRSMHMGVTGKPVTGLGGEPELQMTAAEMEALIQLGHASGKKVSARASGDRAVRMLAERGIDSIDQGTGFSAETARLMADKGVMYVPCLCAAEDRQAAFAAVRTAKENGVTICMGTALLPSQPMEGTVAAIRELELLVEAGLTPREALCAATSGSAALCGSAAAKGIAPGAPGDFLVVAGKPDEDIAAMRSIAAVYRRARPVRSSLPGAGVVPFQVTTVLFPLSGGTEKF